MDLDGNEVDAIPEFYFQLLVVGLRRVQENNKRPNIPTGTATRARAG